MSKEPWELYPHIWKTKSAFFSWMRGGLRRALWEKYPPKIEFKNKQCTPPPEGYAGKAKSGANCSLTGVWTGKSKLEVDHIVGEASLRDWDDVLSFIRHLCTNDENMQLVEKEAHKVKSYSERNGISFEEAQKRKMAIAFGKLPIDEMKNVLQNSEKYETIKEVVEGSKKLTKKRLCELYKEILNGSKEN